MPKPRSIRYGQVEFVKINTEREWRDVYQWFLALSWPSFALVSVSSCVLLNVLFAILYAIGGNCIAEMTPGSLSEAFFFSVQTLATVGYGHTYPQTLYGNVVSTVEIITGMFWFAVMTGLIFVRFSRPRARVLFSNNLVIAPFNGPTTLMLRVANLRYHNMVEVEFRILFMRDEPLLETGEMFRYFYPLKLHFDRLIAFPAALTLRHTIDKQSPLYGETVESLEASRAFFAVSIVGVETVIPASVQTSKEYSWRDIRFGERFVDIYTDHGQGRLTVDYGRIHETEPISENDLAPPESMLTANAEDDKE
jgi:inward rectifier potassium channel